MFCLVYNCHRRPHGSNELPIRGVTFDLWQTLLMDNPELGRARMQVRLEGAIEALRGVGEDFDYDRVREAYRQCYRTCHAIREQDRDVSFKEQIEILIRHIDEGLLGRLPEEAVDRIATIYADSLFHYPPPPHTYAASVLGLVREKGYRVGLISNTGMTPGVTFRKYMEQLGILHYFDTLVFSDEVKLAKPSTEMFHRTTEALGLPAEQVVHVGDHLFNDVHGARQAGMKTIWIETHDDRRKQVDVTPDVTVASLGDVDRAIEELARAAP